MGKGHREMQLGIRNYIEVLYKCQDRTVRFYMPPSSARHHHHHQKSLVKKEESPWMKQAKKISHKI